MFVCPWFVIAPSFRSHVLNSVQSCTTP
jgi:hypothetical protein